MSRNWIRSIGLQVGGQGGQDDLSAMRIRFMVRAASTQTPHAAEIRVYNLSKDHAKRLTSGREFSSLSLSAGYVENSGVIYEGTIIQAQAGRESPTKTFVDFYCRDGDKAYNWGNISKTFAAGSTQRDHVDEILRVLKPLGIAEGTIKGLSEIPYPRAVTLYGMPREILRVIAHSNDASWWFERGKLNHVPNKDTSGENAFDLNANTGLIGMPTETQAGIIVTALINPKFKVGKLLKINEASINRAPWTVNYDAEKQAGSRVTGVSDGTYKIQSIEWHGDTHTEEWYAIMLCYGIYTGAPGIGTENLLPGYSGTN
jgi:hypothetical protein